MTKKGSPNVTSFLLKIATYISISLLTTNIIAKVYPLSELEQQTVLDLSYFTIYEDTSRTISINSLQNGQYEAKEKVYYYQNLHADYLLKLDIVNDTKENGKWVIEFLDPHISVIEFYQTNTKISVRQGFHLPFKNKYYQHKNHVFDIIANPNDTAHCFIRLHSDSHVAFAAKLQTNNYYTQYSLSEYILLGIFYGFLVIMAMYNLILYFFTRMNTRLYYTLYVISCVFSSLAEDGLGFQYIWYNYPEINSWLADFQPIIYLLFFLVYSLSFLDINQNSKNFKKTTIYVFICYTILHIVSINLHLMPVYWVPFYFTPFIIIWNYSLKKYRSGVKSMRFLLLGSTLILISFLIFYLRMRGLVENSIYVVYFFNFAVTIEIILFSIAMGDKLRFIQNENLSNKELIIISLKENEKLSQKVNRELEQKVNERTSELTNAKQKLEIQSEKITKMNLQLDLHNRDLSKKVVEVSKSEFITKRLTLKNFTNYTQIKLNVLNC